MIQETISKREFARRIGVDEKAIRKAIIEGKIKKGVSVNGKIIFDIASHEAKKNLIGISNNTQSKKIHEVSTTKKSSKTNESTYADARIRSEIARAEKSELELEELKGELVKKQDIKDQLFELGKEIRSELESMRNRCKNKIIASDWDPNKLDEILATEINVSLTKVINKCSGNKVLETK